MIKKHFSLISLIVVIMTLSIIYMYQIGYRFDPTSAVKARFDIGKNAVLFSNVEFQWGNICCFKTDKGSRTARVLKKGLLWRCLTAVHFEENNNDSVRTIAWNCEYGLTLIGFETDLEDIYYIEAGPEENRIRKKIKKNEPLILSWDKAYYGHQLNAVALSKEGEILYRMGNHEYNASRKPSDDVRWFKEE